MLTTGSVHFGQLRFWAWVRLCPEFWLACTLRYLLWMFHDVPVVAVVAIVITIIIIMRGKTYESVMCSGVVGV